MRKLCNRQSVAMAVCGAVIVAVLSACQPAGKPAELVGAESPMLAPVLDEHYLFASESPVNRRVCELMNAMVPEIRFNAIGFENALMFLRDLQKVNINPNWAAMEAVGITRATEITLQLRDVTFETALRELLTKAAGKEGNLDYMVREGVIKVSTIEDLSSLKYILIYDVRDLLGHLAHSFKIETADTLATAEVFRRKFGHAKVDKADKDEPSHVEEADVPVEDYQQRAVQAFQNLLRTFVLPDTWAPTGDANVVDHAGLLIVKQTSHGHRELAKLLRQLRDAIAAEKQILPPGR